MSAFDHLDVPLVPGQILSPSEAESVFTAAASKVGPNLADYFEAIVCDVCNDRGLIFRGPHSDGCYTVVECDCQVKIRLGLSDAQADRLSQLYPRVSLASAYEIWQLRKAAKAKYENSKRERLAMADFEGDASAFELARDGYWDHHYGEWSASEAAGPMPRGTSETILSPKVSVSPNSLARAIFALAVAWTFPTIRANALKNARVHLDEMYYAAKGTRDTVVYLDDTDRDMPDDVLAWLKRDPSSKAILSRWNRPDDELAFMEQLREEGRESEWWELMTDFRRRKLDALLKEYFGLDDYRASMIVLKWEQTPRGWRPAKQMLATEWVHWSIEQSGSILGGLQSCTRSLQTKIQLRKRKQARA